MRNGSYELVVAPEEYPGKKYRERYAYEHHLVWWQNTGQIVSTGYVIHHKDHNKRNNSFSNLELLTKSDHDTKHRRTVEKVELTCGVCGDLFKIEPRNYRFKTKVGQKIHCSRSCSAKAQHRK